MYAAYKLRVFDILSCDGIARCVPYTQYANLLFVLAYVKDDPVRSPFFTKQQMSSGKSKFSRFGNDRTASRFSSRRIMAANKRISHFSACKGAASRMRSNAA